MWMLMAVALAAPEWSEIVERLASPVDVRWSKPLAANAFQEACAAGDARACALQKGTPALEVFQTHCAKGESWSCLGVAWLQEASDPTGSFEAYRRLCAEGSDRACADVARARRDGIGTWQSARSARALAEPLCEKGVAHGCLTLGSFDLQNRPRQAEVAYVRAIELGAESGIGGLLRMAGRSEVGRLRDEACDAGLGWACLAAALAVREEDLDRSELLLTRGCDLGDPSSCMTLSLLRRERDLIDDDTLLESLDPICTDHELREACVQAEFVRYGGQVKAFFPGEIQPIRATALRNQLMPYYLDCYKALLDRDRDYTGTSTVELWVDADGLIKGAAPSSEQADADYLRCTVEHTLGKQVWKPAGGAARTTIDATFGHESDVVVNAKKGKDGTEQILRLEAILRENHAVAFDQCYWSTGGSAYDDVFTWIYGTIDREGTFRYEKLVESSGIDEADACIRGIVDGLDLAGTYAYDEDARIYIHFGVLFSMPKAKGFGHGTAADPDTYMNDPWLNLPD